MPIDKRIDIFSLLRNEGKLEKVIIFPGVSVENDPVEHTVDTTFLNPITIDALIRDVSSEALIWRYYGLIPSESKEILVEKQHTNLFRIGKKIKIRNNYYKTYRDESKGFAIKERGDYTVVILERKLID
ncbi:MAG TPA: hypothetical protein VMV43_01645 [Candidatus Nanopelagicaceae bacterium]|nr:hypothetical protein [Candidatus Nanopelagicaceae bacterium]